ASTNFHGLIDEVRFHQRELSPAEVAAQSAVVVQAIAKMPAATRSTQQQQTLEQFFQRTEFPELPEQKNRFASLKEEKQKFEITIPNTMVMAEMETPRPTFIKV